LQEAINNFSEGELSNLFASFCCQKNKDVETFIREKAIQFERTHNARTYLIFDEDTLSESKIELLGYFSLSFKGIPLDEKVSKSKAKKLDGFSKNPKQIRCYLIGQLGKNFSIPNNPLNLETILKLIFSILKQAQDLVGGRVILLECENVEKLISAYENYGFKFLQKQELVQMYMVADFNSL